MALEAGWHADPFGRHQYRYLDGGAWTARIANGGDAGTDEVPVPPAAAPPAATAASKGADLQALMEADERGEAEASVLLGQALRQVGRYDEARAAYERGDQ